MPFTNFTTAWNQWNSIYIGVVNEFNWCNADLDTLAVQTTIVGVRTWTYAALIHLRNMVAAHINGLGPDSTWSSHYMATYYAWRESGGVDMDSILNAMLTAEYDQLQKFIGIEDAYRSALWDQPFNAEFYAALANGFRP